MPKARSGDKQKSSPKQNQMRKTPGEKPKVPSSNKYVSQGRGAGQPKSETRRGGRD